MSFLRESANECRDLTLYVKSALKLSFKLYCEGGLEIRFSTTFASTGLTKFSSPDPILKLFSPLLEESTFKLFNYSKVGDVSTNLLIIFSVSPFKPV